MYKPNQLTCMSPKKREIYKNAGVRLDIKDNLPDDFIGFELEFMYYLSYETLQALKIDDEEKVEKLFKYQQHFLKEHLTVWIEKFTEDIINNTEMDYFKTVANFTREFINSDNNYLTELI